MFSIPLQVMKMGPISKVMGMLPGFSQMMGAAGGVVGDEVGVLDFFWCAPD